MSHTLTLLSNETRAQIDAYVTRLGDQLRDLPEDDRAHLLSYAKAQIELDLELEPAISDSPETIATVLGRLGSPEVYADRLKATLPAKGQAAEEEIQETPPTLTQ